MDHIADRIRNYHHTCILSKQDIHIHQGYLDTPERRDYTLYLKKYQTIQCPFPQFISYVASDMEHYAMIINNYALFVYRQILILELPDLKDEAYDIQKTMINIVEGRTVTFADFLFHTQQLQNALQNYVFSNNRAITKSMLTWWAYQDPAQELLPPETTLEIEHIYARNRQEKERSLSNPRNIEALGNKALLEKRINIRASDYRFIDKAKYYVGFENARKQKKEGTRIKELRELAAHATDFTESDIVQRNTKIIFGFIEFMNSNHLLKEE